MSLKLLILSIFLSLGLSCLGQVPKERFQALQKRVLELEIVLKAVNPDSLALDGRRNLIEYMLTEIEKLRLADSAKIEEDFLTQNLLEDLTDRVRKLEISDSLQVSPNDEVVRKLIEMENCKQNGDC